MNANVNMNINEIRNVNGNAKQAQVKQNVPLTTSPGLVFLVLLLVMVLTPLTAAAATPPFDEPISTQDQAVIRQAIIDNFVIEIDPNKLRNITPQTLADLLDENSYYIPAWYLRQMMEDMEGSFEGIGVYVIEERGRIIVAEPMVGSPGYRAGLLAGDQIVSVDDVSLEGVPLEDAVRMIKGPRGTSVKIGIKRVGFEDPIYFDIIRQPITISSLSARVIDDNTGYLKVNQFSDHTTDNAREVVEDFRAKGIESLIIDLRDNPGGLLIEGVEFSRLFIPRGPITHVLYRDGMTTYSSYLGEKPFENIVALVNSNTASAAEIFAAAFRDRDMGILIGEPTYGKGSVQRIYTLPSGAGFKLTEAMYVSPDYVSIDGVGLTPSINIMRFHPEADPSILLPLEVTRKPSPGTQGDDVKAAQQRLKNMGYTITDTPGIFGSSTFQAVKDFQADTEGLYPYGVLDFSTQRELQRTYIQWLMAPEQDLQLNTALYYLAGHKSSHLGVEPIPYGTVQPR